MSKMYLFPTVVTEVKEYTREIPQGVEMIQAPAEWESARYGEGVVVAVLDTGCQLDHSDLKDNIIGGRNFTTDYNGNPNRYEDNHYHGTHVAGTVAAILNNKGVVGVAPKASLLILKVLSADGSGDYQWIIDAIEYALQWRGPNGERVRIITMSLGGPEDSPELHKVIVKAVRQQVLVVCAAGNEGDNDPDTPELSYPGAYNEVIQVGAVDLHGRLAEFSNTNNQVDLVAPGVDILSTYPGNKYGVLSGTSMATPHVAGALALIINRCEQEFGRTLTESELYAQLCKRTVPLGYGARAEGNGLLNLAVASRLPVR
ncbi:MULTISPECIES: S8 family peptidase [Aneurinibacillus]|nr:MULTISPECIES: S8 family peptidase [Aneurinibacillus]MED0676541.1 S8 family peptidase [Aneurinibacillus thermoaerophilus]MED0735960.1 S8 family peptidase [Aneurinibacillus thermoaerophilus]MED0757084.1 S8 family peptidase [Aneurinibacillus thermoaerophilus]MED0759395.1 S8 family peptidase [Aneurinibacillus thermoaerophilus]